MTVSVHEAKTQLSRLLNLVEEGEEVVIVRHGRPVAQIVRSQTKKKPRLGTMRGEFSWKEGWDKPLSAEESDAFWEGRW
jgi:antitoxin (DNA-binding transcriptional repressor) of toxin-antitoxin stability system